jgi:endonuclease/exonuclease/phosphatase family metal-dependent hydrolase
MRNLTFIFILFATALVAQPVKVMTYNIRLDTPKDGINQWDNRKSKVFTLLKKYDPDILGLQEVLHNQLMDIAGDLKGYEFFGAGRDDGKQKGEYSAILIRKEDAGCPRKQRLGRGDYKGGDVGATEGQEDK